jgi:hypothetical protein
MDARLATDPRLRRDQRIVARPAPAGGSGCIFYERCPIATDACAVSDVPMLPVGGDGHRAACLLAGGVPDERSLAADPLGDGGRHEPARSERGSEAGGGFANAEAVAKAEETTKEEVT